MKNKIYIAIIAILLISITLILGFYYNQDFTEEFNFDKTINFADIETETRVTLGRGVNITYLNSATASLGTLKLKNEGYFTQLYAVPEITGCIVLKEANRKLLPFSVTPESTYYPSARDGQISIRVGTEREYNLTGNYYNRYGMAEPMNSFTKDNIEAIKIYKLSKNNINPLSEGYRSIYNREDTSCEYLIDNEIPLAIIAVN